MEEIMKAEIRDKLIKRFRKVAKADILTNKDGLAITEILERACDRASADLREKMLLDSIESGKAGEK